MKIYSKILISFVLLLAITPAFSQSIKGAVMFGTNVSQVDGDEVFGFKHWGFNVGASAIIPLKNKNWSIVLETIFSQKGAYEKYSPENDDSIPYYRLNLDYVEVPLLIQYNEKNVFTVGTGLSWGQLIEFKEIEHGNETPSNNAYGPYNRNDLDWLLDLRFRLYQKLHFNVRYAYSIAKIRTRTYTKLNSNTTWNRNQYNNFITFRLIYIFNETVPIKKKGKSSKKKK